MSNWTYVSGSLSFEKSPFKVKLNKDGSIKYHESGKYEGWAVKSLPYPDEQVRLGEIGSMHKKVKVDRKEQVLDGFTFGLEISSFPIIKREIKSLISSFSSGEHSQLNYMLQESHLLSSSSSDFDSPQVEKIFKQLVMEQHPSYAKNWKEYTEYTPVELGWENNYTSAILCIHDSLRWCESTALLEQLINFLTELIELGYSFDYGTFNFRDYYKIIVVDIHGDYVEITITNIVTKEVKKEYYQAIDEEDRSTEEKTFPYKQHLTKVDVLNKHDWED